MWKSGFNVIFAFVLIIFVVMFVFSILMFVSPKFRGKIMSRQIKSTKYMMDESKEDLKSIANTTADISNEAITKTTRAVKKGLKDTIFCKHCGAEIDSDSTFCKSCGKEQ